MKNVVQSFKNLWRWGKKAPAALTVAGGVLAYIGKSVKRLADEAYKWGRSGGSSPDQQKAQFTAIVEAKRTETLAEPHRAQAGEREQQRSAEEVLAAFNPEQQREKHRTSLAPEKEKERIGLTTQKRQAEIRVQKAELADAEADNAVKDYEELYGIISGGFGLLSRNPLIFPIIGGCFDLSINYPAMVELSIPPIIAWAGAIGLSALQAAVGHAIGKALQDGHRKAGIGLSVLGLVIIGVVAALRFGSGHFLFTLLLLLAFMAAGAIGSYFHFKKKAGFALKKAKARAEKELEEAIAHLDEIEETLRGLEEVYEKRACKLADDDYDRLTRTLATLSESIARRKEQIATLNKAFDARLAEGLAVIEAHFQQGQIRHSGRGRQGGNNWGRAAAALLLGFVLLGLPSCKETPLTPAEWHMTDMYVDKSLTMDSVYQQDAGAAYNYLIDIFGLSDTSVYVRDRITVNFYLVGHHSVPQRLTCELKPGPIHALADEPARRREIAAFKAELKRRVQEVFEMKADMQGSQIYRGLAHGLGQMMSSGCQHKDIVLMSDMKEEGVMDFWRMEPEHLNNRQDSVIGVLLHDTPLPSDLTGVRALLLTYGKAHSDRLTYRAGQLFQAMLEKRGAQVEIQHNF